MSHVFYRLFFSENNISDRVQNGPALTRSQSFTFGQQLSVFCDQYECG